VFGKNAIKLLTPYREYSCFDAIGQVTTPPIQHCLPAFHNRDTDWAKKIFQKFGITEMEVSDDSF